MKIIECVTCGGPCEPSRVQSLSRGADGRPSHVYYCCPLCGLGRRNLSADVAPRVAPQLSVVGLT